MSSSDVRLLMFLGCLHPASHPTPVLPQTPVQPGDPSALTGWMLGEDPLARHLRPLDPSLLTGGRFEGQTIPPQTIPPTIETALKADLPGWEAEEQLRGTIGVPLLRGRRLAELEIEVSSKLPLESLRLLVPMLPPSNPPPSSPRPLLDWLGNPGGEGLLHAAERNVLLGWLDGPAMEVSALAPLLEDPRFDRLTTTPLGNLLLSRAQKKQDPSLFEDGRARLDAATRLVLIEVAADTPKEQETFGLLQTEAMSSWKIQGDPANILLSSADAAFAKDAANPEAVGGALVSQAALRWRGACPDEPCGGLDRPAVLQTAARWGLATEADLWNLIFWKDAVDHLDASWERASAVYAEDAIVELLAEKLEPRILLLPEPGPPSILAITRALGDAGRTDRAGLFSVLQSHLADLAEALEKRGVGDAEAVHRIAVRARKAAGH